MNNQSRWRSKTLWVAIIALVTFVLKTYFHIVIPSQNELVDLILIVLSALGIFNNPKQSDQI